MIPRKIFLLGRMFAISKTLGCSCGYMVLRNLDCSILFDHNSVFLSALREYFINAYDMPTVLDTESKRDKMLPSWNEYSTDVWWSIRIEGKLELVGSSPATARRSVIVHSLNKIKGVWWFGIKHSIWTDIWILGSLWHFPWC